MKIFISIFLLIIFIGGIFFYLNNVKKDNLLNSTFIDDNLNITTDYKFTNNILTNEELDISKVPKSAASQWIRQGISYQEYPLRGIVYEASSFGYNVASSDEKILRVGMYLKYDNGSIIGYNLTKCISSRYCEVRIDYTPKKGDNFYSNLYVETNKGWLWIE